MFCGWFGEVVGVGGVPACPHELKNEVYKNARVSLLDS